MQFRGVHQTNGYPYLCEYFCLLYRLNRETMQYLRVFVAAIALILSMMSCTPKTTEPISAQVPSPPPPPTENLSPCPKFSDAPSKDDAETNYVLYRDHLKAGDWNGAYSYWQAVHKVAPAADGKRNTILADGIKFCEHFMAQTRDSAYVDTIFALYDQIQLCYPEGGYVAGRKGFDYFYKYPNRSTKEQTFAYFKQSIDVDGLKANDFIINPMSALLVELHEAGKISNDEAKIYVNKILAAIEYGSKNCEGTGCDRWAIVKEYAPVRLEYFEVVQNFYPCSYYEQRYYPDFVENPTDCDVIRTVYSRLKWGGCDENSAELKAVSAAGNSNCVEASAAGPVAEGYRCLRDGSYSCAISKFEQAAAEETSAVKKGEYLLLIAKIYYSHLKSFSRARQYALRAADARSGWGEPYILIGRLYASSGPLCGPGRGWDSQVVVWPAIDMWAKARRIDPSSAAEANKWIGRYSQYMPKREDVFIRNLAAGQSFYVGCWIQESTTIRTAD